MSISAVGALTPEALVKPKCKIFVQVVAHDSKKGNLNESRDYSKFSPRDKLCFNSGATSLGGHGPPDPWRSYVRLGRIYPLELVFVGDRRTHLKETLKWGSLVVPLCSNRSSDVASGGCSP